MPFNHVTRGEEPENEPKSKPTKEGSPATKPQRPAQGYDAQKQSLRPNAKRDGANEIDRPTKKDGKQETIDVKLQSIEREAGPDLARLVRGMVGFLELEGTVEHTLDSTDTVRDPGSRDRRFAAATRLRALKAWRSDQMKAARTFFDASPKDDAANRQLMDRMLAVLNRYQGDLQAIEHTLDPDAKDTTNASTVALDVARTFLNPGDPKGLEATEKRWAEIKAPTKEAKYQHKLGSHVFVHNRGVGVVESVSDEIFVSVRFLATSAIERLRADEVKHIEEYPPILESMRVGDSVSTKANPQRVGTVQRFESDHAMVYFGEGDDIDPSDGCARVDMKDIVSAARGGDRSHGFAAGSVVLGRFGNTFGLGYGTVTGRAAYGLVRVRFDATGSTLCVRPDDLEAVSSIPASVAGLVVGQRYEVRGWGQRVLRGIVDGSYVQIPDDGGTPVIERASHVKR